MSTCVATSSSPRWVMAARTSPASIRPQPVDTANTIVPDEIRAAVEQALKDWLQKLLDAEALQGDADMRAGATAMMTLYGINKVYGAVGSVSLDVAYDFGVDL